MSRPVRSNTCPAVLILFWSSKGRVFRSAMWERTHCPIRLRTERSAWSRAKLLPMDDLSQGRFRRNARLSMRQHLRRSSPALNLEFRIGKAKCYAVGRNKDLGLARKAHGPGIAV